MSLLPCLLSRLEPTELQVQILKLNNEPLRFKWTVLLYPIRTFSFPNCVSALLSILPISLLLHKLQPQLERKNTHLFFSPQKGSYKMHDEMLFMTKRKKNPPALLISHKKYNTSVKRMQCITLDWNIRIYHYDLELRIKFQNE